MREEDELLMRLRQCMASIWAVRDQNDWPVRLNTISHLFAEPYTMDFLNLMEQMEVEKISSISEIHPAALFRLFDLILKGMYTAGIKKDKRQQILIQFLFYLQSMKAGSIFNEDGHNILLAKSEVEKLKENLSLMKLTQESRQEARLVQNLIGLIKAYVEQLYFRAYDITQEIHGPYEWQGQWMLIREFQRLKPRQLWEDFKLVPFDKITFYTVYDSNLEVTIDSYNHMRLKSGNFVHNLNQVLVNVDDKNVDLLQMEKMIKELEECISYNRMILQSMDWFQMVQQYSNIFYYKIQPIASYIGYQWKYREVIDEKIRTGQAVSKNETYFEADKLTLLLKLLI